jgi:hypothetical protein
MEEWKKIIGFDYDYEVSNFGNIRCLNADKIKKRGVNFLQSKDTYGYLRVGLVKNKKSKTIKTHRLVCKYFLPNYDESLTVNHKDYNKQNNHIDNLEMITSSENVLDYQLKVVSKKSKSSVKGVMYHTQVCKWLARITVSGKRYSLGAFNSEEEAIFAVQNPEKFPLKIGKGSKVGFRKFSKEMEEKALVLSDQIGVRKASKQIGVSTTKISALRKERRDLIKH